MVEIEGRSVLTKFIILPKAKGNRTLLGTDLLSSAGLVLDVKNTCRYFWDNPTHKYPFAEELDTPSIVEKMSSSTCQLREGEAQRFEALAIDLFGPLPESKDGRRWILIIEDCTTKWVELFALPNATAKECAITLIEEVLLRYGIPRRFISDNGTQFVSVVMHHICYLFNIHQSLIPVYHPQANPVEQKNRDLKPRLTILVQDKHDCWSEKLPFFRFALNTAKCETTGQTETFLNFGRELRTPSEVVNDIRVIIQNDNFVPEITEQKDSRKFYADKKRKTAPTYQPGEHVFVASHPLSNAAQERTSYEIASLDNPEEPLGVYHTSALAPCNNDKVKPLIPLRKRGRPPKVP
ncbi:integrase catalytic domain-containing protein [Trichonephila clavipes]|nr:integrase catalytic domain-containing protein [Trichonephila clavipes]